MPPAAGPPVLLDVPDARPPSGWRVVEGFELEARPWDLADRHLLCRGDVDDQAAAEASLLALARGAGLWVRVGLAGDARRRYLEDLDRIAAASSGTSSAPSGLSGEQQALLELLRSGRTVTEAAGELHRSRRTVHRMLADARARLGVASTAEAVARWAQLEP